MDLERAEDLLRQGRYAEAVDRFRELLSMEPERPDLRGRVAEAYRLAGNPERAFHHFHKAAALYGRQQDLLGAARMLEAANHVSPNEPDVLYRLAEVLKRLGKHRPLAVILHNLVKAASAPGDRRRLWALDELVQLNPNELDVQVERAKALSEVGRVREAVLVWQRVTDHLAKRGVDFAPWLERAARAAPDVPAIGVPLAQLLLRHRRAREALSLLVPFYEKFPDDVAVLETLLAALTQLDATDKIVPAQLELLKARTRAGQRAEALEEVKQLLAKVPGDPRVLEVCAHACTAFGLTGEACRLWFDLAGIYDRYEMAKERDRVVLRILEAKPDHEGALELGARVLRAGGRTKEALQLEAKLAEVRARSVDDLPALSDAPVAPSVAPRSADTAEEPTAFARPSSPAPVPQITTDAAPHTMVLEDADVLEVSEAAREDEDDYEDVFDADTPALPTRAAQGGLVGDETATGEMPALATSDDLRAPRRPSAPFHAGAGPHPRPSIRDPFFADTAEEAPEALEEATFRMDEEMSSELEALRAELEDDEATATELEAQREPSIRQPRVRGASRPNARLVSDLLEEMVRKKQQH